MPALPRLLSETPGRCSFVTIGAALTLLLEANDAASFFGPGQRLVRADHSGDARGDRLGPRRGAARFVIHVQDYQFVGGGEEAFLGMKHLMKTVQALCV